MTRRPLCDLCQNHRPGSLRICIICNRKIGPGCHPEQCLHRQFNHVFGLCKECHRIGRIKLLTKSTPVFLNITLEAGYWECDLNWCPPCEGELSGATRLCMNWTSAYALLGRIYTCMLSHMFHYVVHNHTCLILPLKHNNSAIFPWHVNTSNPL